MYIDPGLGSIAIQALIGFAIAIPIFIAASWRRIKSWLSQKRVVSETHQPEL